MTATRIANPARFAAATVAARHANRPAARCEPVSASRDALNRLCPRREGVRAVRRHMRSDLEHDLGMVAQRHPARRAAPATAADEHRDLTAARRRERRQAPRRERLAPGTKQIRKREHRPGTDQHQAGGVKRHQAPVASGRRDAAGRQPNGWPDPDPGRHDHHAVGPEHLHVHPVPSAQPRPARADHRPGCGRMKT